MNGLKSLDEKYAKDILLKLLEEDQPVMITRLYRSNRNYYAFKNVIKKMEEDGLVEVKESVEGRKSIYVSLTEKGRAVAEKIKEAEDIAAGRTEMHPDWKEKFKNMRAMVHFNTYENVIRITDYLPDGTVRYVDVDVNIKGNKMYLYCEACGSFDCEHINFIWSHPKLRRDLLKKAQEDHLIIVDGEKAEKENGNRN